METSKADLGKAEGNPSSGRDHQDDRAKNRSKNIQRLDHKVGPQRIYYMQAWTRDRMFRMIFLIFPNDPNELGCRDRMMVRARCAPPFLGTLFLS